MYSIDHLRHGPNREKPCIRRIFKQHRLYYRCDARKRGKRHSHLNFHDGFFESEQNVSQLNLVICAAMICTRPDCLDLILFNIDDHDCVFIIMNHSFCQKCNCTVNCSDHPTKIFFNLDNMIPMLLRPERRCCYLSIIRTSA